MDAVLQYALADVRLTQTLDQRLNRLEREQKKVEAKTRQVERRYLEDEVLPLGTHDWRS